MWWFLTALIILVMVSETQKCNKFIFIDCTNSSIRMKNIKACERYFPLYLMIILYFIFNDPLMIMEI